jgi:hypothetical protein
VLDTEGASRRRWIVLPQPESLHRSTERSDHHPGLLCRPLAVARRCDQADRSIVGGFSCSCSYREFWYVYTLNLMYSGCLYTWASIASFQHALTKRTATHAVQVGDPAFAGLTSCLLSRRHPCRQRARQPRLRPRPLHPRRAWPLSRPRARTGRRSSALRASRPRSVAAARLLSACTDGRGR